MGKIERGRRRREGEGRRKSEREREEGEGGGENEKGVEVQVWEDYDVMYMYCVAGNFRKCKFSHNRPYIAFRKFFCSFKFHIGLHTATPPCSS